VSQNIFIDEDANIQLIDNDLLLGGAQVTVPLTVSPTVSPSPSPSLYLSLDLPHRLPHCVSHCVSLTVSITVSPTAHCVSLTVSHCVSLRAPGRYHRAEGALRRRRVHPQLAFPALQHGVVARPQEP
jgi:hypothetical protein